MVKRCADRYAAGEAMSDRSSRPRSMPDKTCPATTKRIVSLRLRLRKRIGPVQLAAALGVAPSTAHRVLVLCRLNRWAHVDRATGEPVRRYEHDAPGDLLHVDVKQCPRTFCGLSIAGCSTPSLDGFPALSCTGAVKPRSDGKHWLSTSTTEGPPSPPGSQPKRYSPTLHLRRPPPEMGYRAPQGRRSLGWPEEGDAAFWVELRA